MEQYKTDFVKQALACGALRLGGPFRLKSGRLSPYFFDTGRFSTGRSLAALAAAYAQAIRAALPLVPDVLFGPAYKGIPLAVATALELDRQAGVEVGYLFDRKEAKLHGEHSAAAVADAAGEARRRLVGHLPGAGARVVLLDDVLTTGGTKLEACELLRTACPEARIEALVVALDRQEAGAEGGRTPAQQFTEASGIPVHAVLTAADLLIVLRKAALVEPGELEPLARYLAEQRA